MSDGGRWWFGGSNKNIDLTKLIPACFSPNEIGPTVLLFLFFTSTDQDLQPQAELFVLSGVGWGGVSKLIKMFCSVLGYQT